MAPEHARLFLRTTQETQAKYVDNVYKVAGGKDADKNFKDAFVPQLRKVLAVYPQAKVKQVKGGLLLLGSPPPIPFKP